MSLDKSGKKYIIDLQFLPSLEYFIALKSHENILLDQNEHFVKQTYRNRCYILGANSILGLTVPVVKGSQKTAMRQVGIDYTHDWLNPLWKSIHSAYGKSPFFEFFSEEVRSILYTQPVQLWDLSSELLSFCLKCLEMDKNLSLTDKYHGTQKPTIMDMRGVIHPKVHFESNPFYRPFEYNQIFGNNFVPNLSIIDLLFCEGPNAIEILERSTFNR